MKRCQAALHLLELTARSMLLASMKSAKEETNGPNT